MQHATVLLLEPYNFHAITRSPDLDHNPKYIVDVAWLRECSDAGELRPFGKHDMSDIYRVRTRHGVAYDSAN